MPGAEEAFGERADRRRADLLRDPFDSVSIGVRRGGSERRDGAQRGHRLGRRARAEWSVGKTLTLRGGWMVREGGADAGQPSTLATTLSHYSCVTLPVHLRSFGFAQRSR